MMGPSPSKLRKSVLQAAVFYAAILCQPDASQAQNLAEDRKLFETTCTPCHNYDKGGEPDMYGLTLNLYGVVGRKSASVARFQYSEDLRKSDIVWDEAIIDKFITAPKKLFPGTRMELPGVEDVKTRTGIIRYLRSLAH
jgi:cytochrome c